MKLILYSSLLFLVLFLGCDVVEDMLLPDYRIKDCYWEDKVDKDNDGYTRSRYLVVDYKYGSGDIEYANIYVDYAGRNSPVPIASKHLWDVDGEESIKISDLTHNQYNFKVQIYIHIKGESADESFDWDSSDDQDLKVQYFETDAQDQ